MQKVIHYDSVHVRLGELMKAIAPQPVPAYMMAFVANQHDWMKRARELRYLGWKISVHRERVGSRRDMAFYTLVSSQPWPKDPSAGIRRYERERGSR
jgi:hypothetical protein